jgi:hypothetical protein
MLCHSRLTAFGRVLCARLHILGRACVRTFPDCFVPPIRRAEHTARILQSTSKQLPLTVSARLKWWSEQPHLVLSRTGLSVSRPCPRGSSTSRAVCHTLHHTHPSGSVATPVRPAVEKGLLCDAVFVAERAVMRELCCLAAAAYLVALLVIDGELSLFRHVSRTFFCLPEKRNLDDGSEEERQGRRR